MLEHIFGHLVDNTPHKYNCRVKTYPDGRRNIVCFSKEIFNPDGWSECDNIEWVEITSTIDGSTSFVSKLVDSEHTSDYEYVRQYTLDGVRSDNLKRAKEKVFDIAFENMYLWKYMVTFTLDKKKINRYSSEEVNFKFKHWLKNSCYRKGLNYVLVAEHHKDGAIHFHGLLSDGLNYRYIYKKDNNGRKIYVIDDFPFGAARAVPIDAGTESNCCKYITKYMTKDFCKIFGNMYWAGGKLLTRDVQTEYFNVDFNEVPAEALDIINANYQVKYVMEGVSL